MLKLLYISLCLIILICNCRNNSKEISTNSVNSTLTDSLPVKSVEAITAEIRKNPADANLFAKRGKTYFQLNRLREAISDFEIAIKIDSLKPEYYFQLAEYYILSEGQVSKAKQLIEKCLVFFPENTEALIKLSELYLYIKDYKKSMEVLKKVEQIDRHIAYIYFIKGIIFKETGDTSKAIENFQITVEKEPDFYNAYILLGNLFAKKNDTIAIAYYKTALKIIPNSIEVHYNLGMFYQENSRYNPAINEYNYIINNLDSLYVFAWHNIGYIYMNYFQKYEMAIPYFDKTIKLKPEYVEVWYHRGLCYEMLGDYLKAKQDYEKTFEIVSNYELGIKGLNRIDNKIGK